MTSTIAALDAAYPSVRVVRAHLPSSWAAYLPAEGAVLFSHRLTGRQEAAAVARIDLELSAAGVPRVPSAAPPCDDRE